MRTVSWFGFRAYYFEVRLGYRRVRTAEGGWVIFSALRGEVSHVGDLVEAGIGERKQHSM